MFTSFKQTFHSLFTFISLDEQVYVNFIFKSHRKFGWYFLSFSCCGSPEDVGWVVYFWWLYSLTQCNVYWVSAPCQACLCLCGVTEAPTCRSLLCLPLDTDTRPHFSTRDNNPTLGGWGDWITLMIQMSSFLIQRITDGGGGSSWLVLRVFMILV